VKRKPFPNGQSEGKLFLPTEPCPFRRGIAMTVWRRILMEEEGQTLVEYALLVALISLVTITALRILGFKLANIFNTVNNALPT